MFPRITLIAVCHRRMMYTYVVSLGTVARIVRLGLDKVAEFQKFLSNCCQGGATPVFASVIIGSYDYRWLALSAILAVPTLYTALDLVGRVTAACSWIRTFIYRSDAAPAPAASTPCVPRSALPPRILAEYSPRPICPASGRRIRILAEENRRNAAKQ